MRATKKVIRRHQSLDHKLGFRDTDVRKPAGTRVMHDQPCRYRGNLNPPRSRTISCLDRNQELSPQTKTVQNTLPLVPDFHSAR